MKHLGELATPALQQAEHRAAWSSRELADGVGGLPGHCVKEQDLALLRSQPAQGVVEARSPIVQLHLAQRPCRRPVRPLVGCSIRVEFRELVGRARFASGACEEGVT